MEDNKILKALLRKNSLRRLLKMMTLADVEKLSTDVVEIKDELLTEEKQRLQQVEELNTKREEILKLIKEAGFDEHNFFQNNTEPKEVKVRKPVEAKYQLGDLKWSGRGRMPIPFREYVENGGKLKELLI